MDEKTKKIGTSILIIAAAIAGVMLLFSFIDLLHAIFTAAIEKVDTTSGRATFLSFMQYTSLVLAILIFATAIGLIMGFFSKDKVLRIIILSIEGATIIAAIVICIVARNFKGDVGLTTVTVFQASLLQIIGFVTILLTASAIWYIPGFRKIKAKLETPQPSIAEEKSL